LLEYPTAIDAVPVTMPHYFHGGQLHHHAGLAPTPNHIFAEHVNMPRNANPYPYPEPLPAEGLRDFGEFLNSSNKDASYFHGLTGVDQYLNYLLTNALVAMFFIGLAVVLWYRWTLMGHAHLRKLMAMGKESDQRYWMYNHHKTWASIKKNILYAPLGKVRHNQEYKIPFVKKADSGMGTLPSRFHTFLLVILVVTNLAYCLALDWSALDSSAVIAELRGRTGQLAALNIIPTVLFALRNNPLLWITGVSYDCFNLLHRWCARIMIIEAVLHTLAWAINVHKASGAAQVALSLSTSKSFAWGMVATVCFGTIFVVAPAPIRHTFYETFLNGHRLLVLFALVGVYVHLDAANLPQLPYAKLAFALWGAELFWRIARICYLNVSRKRGITKVRVEALPGEACRVTFELRRPWKYKPGCHVHAYLPTIALWSSHPFSIAWAEQRTNAPELEMRELEKLPANNPSHILGINHRRPSLAPRMSSYGKESTMPTTTVTEITTSKAPNTCIPREANVTTISLIMRKRKGMTQKLYEKADAMPNKTFTTWGAIEGPYGGYETFASYGTVVLFAGGVGITHCVGYVHHLLTQYAQGTCATQKILLVWSVPNTESLEWVRTWMDQILRMEHRRDVLRIQLYVTKPRHRGEVVSNTGSVQMFPGRCNPSTIMAKEMPERIGAVGVTVCGPGAFADSVRKAVREVIDEGAVDFIEEAFTY
jgi:predicted ferric reductase